MAIQLEIKLNEKLYLRDPLSSELGKRIIKHSIILIHKLGFEAFTFKKLAREINTTEAGVYRYFENKHLLLLYLVDWYWSWMEFRVMHETTGVRTPAQKLKRVIALLSARVEEDERFGHINEKLLYEIVMAEGAKSWLTKNVKEYNKARLFKPYKDLCARIASIIQEYEPRHRYPHSLATTLIEMSQSLRFYMQNLPALTDLSDSGDESALSDYLSSLVFKQKN